jgi:hypothetical protein
MENGRVVMSDLPNKSGEGSKAHSKEGEGTKVHSKREAGLENALPKW